ncbi:CopM family metallochaperone [Terrihabitans sp. B22-R8]|uniref:CopM family metallochaperone n=1 Tax=Terrihabitans sp. B22-R8 TaxID=3425128 RepID=UPI00403CA74D
MSKILVPVAAILALALTGVASAQDATPGHSGHGSHSAMETPQSETDSASTRDFKAADTAMMKSMAIPYTGDADVDYREHMIPHHQGAIDMAKVALKHAKNADTKRLAQKVIDDQEKEIAEMKDWLAKNKK